MESSIISPQTETMKASSVSPLTQGQVEILQYLLQHRDNGGFYNISVSIDRKEASTISPTALGHWKLPHSHLEARNYPTLQCAVYPKVPQTRPISAHVGMIESFITQHLSMKGILKKVNKPSRSHQCQSHSTVFFHISQICPQ